jgi:hypothetical protein
MTNIRHYAWLSYLLIIPAAIWAGRVFEGGGTATYSVEVGALSDSCQSSFSADVYLKSDGTYQATIRPTRRFWVNKTPGTSEFESVEALCLDETTFPFTFWGTYTEHEQLDTITEHNLGGTNWVLKNLSSDLGILSMIRDFSITLEQTIHHTPPSFGTEIQRKVFSATSLADTNIGEAEVAGIVKDWEGNVLTGIYVVCINEYHPDGMATDSEGRFRFFVFPYGEKYAGIKHAYSQGYNPFLKTYEVPKNDIEVILIPQDVAGTFAILNVGFGTVQVKAPGGTWVTATTGMVLDDGYKLRTLNDSRAHVLLPNSMGGFQMNSDTEATIQIGNHTTMQSIINLAKGLLFIDKHVNGAGIYIYTPNAVLGDHGTKFTVGVSNTYDVVNVVEGSVWSCADGSTTTNLHGAGKKVTITDAGAVTETTLSVSELNDLNSSFSNLSFLVSGYTSDEIVSDFSSGASGWQDDGSGCWSVSGGRYVMTGNKGNVVRHSRYNLPGYNDYSIEADVRKTQGDSETYVYGYGLYARCNASGTYNYEFTILEDGRYMIGKTVNGAFTTIVAFTNAPELNTGFNTWNKLRMDVSGGELAFFANDAWLTSIYDEDIASGYPGLFAVDAAASTVPDTVQFDNVTITYQPRGATAAGGYVKNDFDADGKSDLVVYNIQTGDWYIRQSSDGQLYNSGPVQWGWSGALPASGDFDADGLSDISVYNVQTGDWYIRQSSNGQLFNGGAYQFGWAGALPAPGDFDGDGISDITVYNVQTGDWYVRLSSDGQIYNGGAYQFGWAGALPSTGDFDDDGIADFSVYNIQTGDWYIRQSSNGQLYNGGAYQFGWSGALPCQGDYDGDGITDIAVYNLQTGDWYILQSSNGQLMSGGAIQFGWSGAIPTYGE